MSNTVNASLNVPCSHTVCCGPTDDGYESRPDVELADLALVVSPQRILRLELRIGVDGMRFLKPPLQLQPRPVLHISYYDTGIIDSPKK